MSESGSGSQSDSVSLTVLASRFRTRPRYRPPIPIDVTVGRAKKERGRPTRPPLFFYSQRAGNAMMASRRDSVFADRTTQRGIRSIRILEYTENHLLPFVCEKEQIATVEARAKAGGRVGRPPFHSVLRGARRSASFPVRRRLQRTLPHTARHGRCNPAPAAF